ncbi:histidinol dehydrogenase [Moritella sp. 5]|uniref:histidinol dehydrogenase n=1 Tax=Moritella sp. 5 TaxID=2746231 RepID=UPI001BAA5273|nr:histidinol dehydrogenase [Moritella sp. 5]QUM80722.1 histidinol dehydrogenase [Moritella sp. 5]
MKTVVWDQLSQVEQSALLMRPAISNSAKIGDIVTDIIAQVRNEGDTALKALTAKLDNVETDCLRVTTAEIEAASQRVDDETKQAIKQAQQHIHLFHEAQVQDTICVETMPGVMCEMHTVALDAVGLYIPGGTAPLPSTVLMLATPANIANCERIVLTTPPPIADEILFSAQLCGVTEIYTLGGAQAIAALAYGSESILKVDKIFGPGNAFVTEAKRQVSMDIKGAAIDMPAGPSEVLVIADADADAGFIAADLLSQAEHGPDSQSILVVSSSKLAAEVAQEVQQQLACLSRQEIAVQSIASSLIIVTNDIDTSIAISNLYAPEHLIVQTENARSLLPKLKHAGSIFLGAWSPESVGDYASGTNHVLPTYGYTKTYSSLGLADFTKRFTVQELTQDGLKSLAKTVTCLADAEGLDAHKRAVTIRIDRLGATL